MSLIRPVSTAFRASALRPALAQAPRAQACLQSRFASSQGYGDGKGDPVAEDPQKQGKNPSSELEHPGPPPPKVAQGKGKSPDENAPSSNEMKQSGESKSSSSSQKSSGSSSSSSKSASSSNNKDPSKDPKYGKKGAQPKILNENPPSENDPSVREHNEEMSHRAERAHEQIGNDEAKNDKVSKGFWSGTGGRDRDP